MDETAGMRSYGRRVGELAADQPEKTVIVAVSRTGYERRIAWCEFNRWSNAAARLLERAGVDERALVVVALPNGIEHYVATAAAWKLGACVLPLSPKLPVAEFEALLKLANPTVVIADQPVTEAITTARLYEACTVHDSGPLPDRTARPARAVASGGSTGCPKIIRLPDAMEGVPGELGMIGDVTGLKPAQTQLVAGPLYHNMPCGLSQIGLFHGHSLVVMESFDATLALDLIERHRVSFAALVPTHLSRMAKVPDIQRRDLSSIQAILHSAAVCPEWVKRAWIRLVGPQKIYEGFGATEAVGICAIRGDEWLLHPGSVGRPVDCELRIVDEAGRPLPPGEVGEIYTRLTSGNKSYEYLGAPPAKTTADGFVSLGDLGWVDADGYLFVADRRVDMIITGGVNVYPAEVESTLSEHPAVGDVAVVGLPDEDLGRRVHAVIELRNGYATTANELTEFCSGRLERTKIPRTLEFVERLPRNDAGKIRRSDLVGARE